MGVAPGVKTDGGILDFVTREIEIECLPGNIPEHLPVDVTELGDRRRAAHLRADGPRGRRRSWTTRRRSSSTSRTRRAEKEPEVAAAEARRRADRARGPEEGQGRDRGRGRERRRTRRRRRRRRSSACARSSASATRATDYEDTRHNAGFRVVERLAAEEGIRIRSRECTSRVGRGTVGGEPVLLALPQTFMNASGEAVRALCKKNGIDPSDLCVVFDDIDLPLGTLRMRARGSAGGQKGMASVIARLGHDRVRAAAGGRARGALLPASGTSADYVLEPFAKGERELFEESRRTGPSRLSGSGSPTESTPR